MVFIKILKKTIQMEKKILIVPNYMNQKNIILNSTHCFVMKIRNKRELQQIVFSHSPDIDIKTLGKCTAKRYFFIIIETTLPADNTSRFRKNHLERI